MIEDTFSGPKPMRDRDGFVVVQFGEHEKCDELPHAFTVSVIGWGHQLLATGDNVNELAEHAKGRYKGKVRVSTDSKFFPFDNGKPNW